MRNKFTAVKTAKRRSKSSTTWIKRQINDPFVKQAQQQGFRSRSAFKIIEIDDKFKIFKKGKIVVDLGAAPGGWSQVAVEKVGKGKVFAVDILEMKQIEGVEFLQQDFLKPEASENIIFLINKNFISGDFSKTRKCDIVLSDMAENTCGDARTDHLRIVDLLEKVLDFASQILVEDGIFVGKIFQGGAGGELLQKFKQHFKTVKHFKPNSSRKESTENYIIALGFKEEV
ncbi:MAG: RlmE family methyltransferase [Rickettsiaceae bacterium]|jgi:23S rRNA (uridine2552-2'-O)-methyltransferase|nr:RlmE family methyltransferase [Rickettsiaceae bacterium]